MSETDTFNRTMNILQSFMGCMYPGSIRTDSIESIDQDHPECRFQAINLDEHCHEVSRGELQLTERDLVYFRSSKFPTRWPIGYIRRYGFSVQKTIFLFEAGRRCPTGEGIFAFRVDRGSVLASKLQENIDKIPTDEMVRGHAHVEDAFTNCGFNRLITSQSSHRASNTKSYNQEVPRIPNQNEPAKRDAATYTETYLDTTRDQGESDPRPLSYALIDFDTTKNLNELAQAHAASRTR